MKKNKIVVVGGGVIGMIAALLVKTKKNSVFLIEQNKELGGLFRSRKFYKNLFFDYGSHFIKQTGIKKLDKLLFGNLDKKKWHILGNLRGASFFEINWMTNPRLLTQIYYQQKHMNRASIKSYEIKKKN